MKYTINGGFSFLDSDGSTKTGGDTIELSDDVAAAHSEKVTPLEAPATGAARGPALSLASRRDQPADNA